MNYEFLLDGYNTADQKVLHLEMRTEVHSSSYNYREEKVFLIEDELNEEDKLKIIDHHTDGLGSYLIDIMKKFVEDKDTIKKSSWGTYNLNSLRKWVRENDPRGVFKNVFESWYTKHYLEYRIIEDWYKIKSDFETPTTDWGYKRLYDGKNVIHQWFHELLHDLYKKENKYFKEHDPKHMICKDIEELHNSLGSELWEVPELLEIFNHRYENITEDKAKELKEAMKNINTYIKDIVYDLKNGGK